MRDLKIAVVGGGSWGTALSIYLARLGFPLNLWVYESELVQIIREKRENSYYLPGCPIPELVTPTGHMGEAVHEADLVISVVPSHVCRSVYEMMLPRMNPEAIFLSATKGIENCSLKCMSQVYNEIGKRGNERLAVLSGPSFALEVASDLPTAVVVASENSALAQKLQKLLSSKSFRLYTNDDVRGVELAGATKNIIAIATGVCHGLELGANAEAAVITRGLAEIGRLVKAAGGRMATVAGLAGAGDLILTCKGRLSRNRKVGIRLGQGENLETIIKKMNMIAEGIKTTESVFELGGRLGIEMPITDQIYQVLYQEKNPRHAVTELMERTLKEE
jgi:glycerol-3-phosphate dehydrogenase (NAD(P)+)